MHEAIVTVIQNTPRTVQAVPMVSTVKGFTLYCILHTISVGSVGLVVEVGEGIGVLLMIPALLLLLLELSSIVLVTTGLLTGLLTGSVTGLVIIELVWIAINEEELINIELVRAMVIVGSIIDDNCDDNVIEVVVSITTDDSSSSSSPLPLPL